MVIDHWSFSRLVVFGTRDVTRFVKWPKHIRLKSNSHVSSEVSEHMIVIPVVVALLLVMNCDHSIPDAVETLVSLVGDIRCRFNSVGILWICVSI